MVIIDCPFSGSYEIEQGNCTCSGNRLTLKASDSIAITEEEGSPRDVNSSIGFYSSVTSASLAAIFTPLATLTPFPQLPYSSPTPISTPSSSSSTVGTSSRPAPSSSACPPALLMQGTVDSCILILPTADSFNKQSSCAKSISEIIKERTCCMSVPYGTLGRKEPRYVTRTSCTRMSKKDMGRQAIRQILGKAKYQELKANAERLHIETGSPMLTDKQLMFEVVDGSNNGHVYGFGSQFATISVERWGGSNSLLSISLYLLRLPMSPTSRGRRGCRDTCSKHRTSSLAS
ncbi:hypothetical protein M9H77_30777 [Catharanthus roseus]|uniref:Uncharacterized protein n=1 Tax=Catharanthus roseus TaxID=4058 RepID=A0ACB9ZY72_CATRO|nr:hypothetical protein M9H77_30777 [Catharanthus roseus]